MSTLDEALSAVPPNGRPCDFLAWMNTQTAEDQASIRRALYEAKGTVPITHIFRVLRDLGCPSSVSSLQRHRRGLCTKCLTSS